jgi:triosephosphate isomerase
MSRKPFIAGNWKMNLTRTEAVELASALAAELDATDAVDLAVCPPFVHLPAVGEALGDGAIALGAQDVFYEDNGAYTGEVSTAMLAECGCRYVICGHSERRHVIGEPDEVINRKVLKVLADGLEPILCVGELLAEREAGRTGDVVRRQVTVGLEGVARADARRVTIAYEPVWAIGTGVTAKPEQAQEVHEMIRRLLADAYGEPTAQAIRIQYGGSVKPANAADLLALSDVDGALVGGASLKTADFAAIARAGG